MLQNPHGVFRGSLEVQEEDGMQKTEAILTAAFSVFSASTDGIVGRGAQEGDSTKIALELHWMWHQ